MKTAVSIPDAVFDAADRFARRHGLSRSEVYTRALERLLADEPDQAITARLDAVHSRTDGSIEPVWAASRMRGLDPEPW